MAGIPESPKRLFVALFPDSEARNRLRSLSLQCTSNQDARCVPNANLHLTLKFLGLVNESTETCLVDSLSRIHGQAFSLEFNQVVYRKRQRMLWATTASKSQQLDSLVAQVEQVTGECGVTKSEYRFTPHITLARKVSSSEARYEIDEIRVAVSEFCLVQSETRSNGAEYRIIHSWSLES